MKLFISWSGELSQRLALHLGAWLPNVLPFVEAWVSSEDIPKGVRWGAELATQLEGTDSGIVCLVPDNLNAAWLNFEAGALSKSVTEGHVHPFLFGLDSHDLVGPISQFQATRFSKDDVHKLVKALNSEAGTAAMGAYQSPPRGVPVTPRPRRSAGSVRTLACRPRIATKPKRSAVMGPRLDRV
jgi:hypothetical protein